MIQKVKLHNVKKNQRVILTKELPTSFGNRHTIKKDARGDIKSEGFIAGMLKVEFYTHMHGKENVQFNELSAAEYLVTDVFV